MPTSFHNKAGSYELVRVEGSSVYYSFTNRLGKVADAIMPLLTWRHLAERARPA